VPLINKLPAAFWHAFGTGSLFAAAALVLLTFLATDDLSSKRIFIIVMLVLIAFGLQIVVMMTLLDGKDVNVIDMSHIDHFYVWSSVISFLLIGGARTKVLLTDKWDLPGE
jgi:hypothetical protein